VLDFDVHDGTPFLVMQYAPNGTLRHRHPRGTRVPIAIIVEYLQQIVSALQYALGIVVYEWLGGARPFNGTFLELYS
jgi:serine/threonine protein kinase